MSLPIFLHNGMVGAPALSISSVLDVLNTCLVTGFNSQSVSSASCSAGVVTLNFATAPGFSAKDTIKIVGATNPIFNGNFRVIVATGNQLTFAVMGAPDGVVAGSLSCKFAPLGWESLFSNSTTNVFRSLTSATQACARFKINSSSLYLRGYATMSSVDAGENLFPALAFVSGDGVGYPVGSSVGQPWVLVGDDKFFYFFFSNSNGINQFYFGDLKSFLISDNFCAVAPRAFPHAFPSGNNEYDGYLMKSVAGTVGQGLKYIAANDTYYTPLVNDFYTGNVVVAGVVFAVELNAISSSVRGVYPGALNLLAKNESSTPFFEVKENISGYSGRVIFVRGYSDKLLAFALDNDWRL